ncbi:cytochrome b5 reductase 4-like [Pollicipes pollicipes]|uniref:cytochrome b5 reductase 4-like n=1 Tax=Pollicipes pollicipes TaxID=41117 RepID=UPI0018850DE1|nr:cytochrome b5 reductase 4-like [Pollicipes pollicipes]
MVNGDAHRVAMATGNPRNKVALAPGRSLMDWIRLTNSGADLTGVYNVSRYVEYHPGGADELMRGVGADATDLFDSVHRWVNYEGMLKKCLVGKYVGEQHSARALIKPGHD